MLDNIHWLGHDSFRIDGDQVVYIDPWQLTLGQPVADLVMITHEHFDHCSYEDIEAVSDSETVVLASKTAADQLASQLDCEIRPVVPGDSLTVAGVDVRVVSAYNTNKFRAEDQPFHGKVEKHVGYVFTIGDTRIYHAGDTDEIPEMADLDVNVALLPVSGTYVMTAEEAVKAAERIGPDVVIPMHWGAIVGERADAERFAAQYSGKTVILDKE